MQVFRITLARWADRLTASGQPARWNSQGRQVIYTAESRALACLENVVHRSGEGLNGLFRTLVIDVPDDLPVEILEPADLPSDWASYLQYTHCQARGDDWLRRGETPILRVPSAIVPYEHNYLLNPLHPDFRQIRLLGTEPFIFDARIKRD